MNYKEEFLKKKYSIKDYIERIIIYFQTKYWIRKGVFPIDINRNIGIGAKLIWCLEISLYCKEHNLKPYFRISDNDSRDAEDFFGKLFISSPPSNIKFIKIHSINQLHLKKDYNKHLTIQNANSLIIKHLIPRSEINTEVEQFIKCNFENKKVLGIHYRGTDKIEEAPFVSYNKTFSIISKCLELNPDISKIFITTDNMDFIEFMKSSYLSDLICYHDDSYRSNDGIAIHKKNDLNKSDINKDAIINMLILSKCSFIIKSASFLSSLSILFNPTIPYVMLNKPYDKRLFFPENALIKNNAFDIVI